MLPFAFIQHIGGIVRRRQLRNVTTVLCSEDSIDLPPASIDLAFLCDVYHHFEYPKSSLASIHAALKSGGRNIKLEKALDCIWGYGVGIDLTRRDLQIASRDMKRPWEIGKAFDASAPCGPLQPAEKIGHPSKGRIMLKVNGKTRQNGDLAQMIWNVPEIIAQLSSQYELCPGDIILTGTPAGVGPVLPGDAIECSIDKLGSFAIRIGPKPKQRP